MTKKNILLIQALCHPSSIIGLPLDEWDLLLRQARSAGLMARLAAVLKSAGLFDHVPSQPIRHLESALVVARAHKRVVRWEVSCLSQALATVETPLVMLKGAAYVLANLPASEGRIFNDVDILVAKDSLASVEAALTMHGWVSQHRDPYDQRYYRQWMHELPPMRHIKRKTVLDVHHTILPETARLHPDPDKLVAAAIKPEQDSRLMVLAPVDMVLHSATHLFHDGELEHGLRDLFDLDALLRHFGSDPAFWQGLVPRAEELELSRPLYYALQYTHTLLETPVPAEVLSSVRAGQPIWPLSVLMDGLFERGLVPDHPSCAGRLSGVARWFLYVRSHALRMPLYLLIPHLLRKAFRRHVEAGQ